jgi:HEAT repeat protein
MKYPSADARLVSFSQSPDSAIRIKATEALVDTMSHDHNAIAAMMKDPKVNVRRTVAKLMAKSNSSKITKALEMALTDSDMEVRKNAAVSLGKKGSVSSVGQLMAALKEEPVGSVRKKILEAIVKVSDKPKMVRLCTESLRDDDIAVRHAAAKALGESDTEFAVFPLVEVLQDSSLGIQKEAALALGNLKDVLGLGPLFEALESKNQNVREGAAEALKKITGKDIGPDPKLWKEAKKEMFLSDIKEVGKIFSIPVITALAVVFII